MTTSDSLILTRSAGLRMLTLLLFYFTQGFPVGLFFYAVPGWMASEGAGAGAVAAVVGMAALPWSLKLINGFLIDRYTFLPMGRRRIWIIGAQAMIVAVLLTGALLAPDYSDVAVLSAIAFSANLAVTFQDVGIDSLAVDIMPEDERAKASGIMFGAQLLGISATTALGGAMLQQFGVTACLIVASLIPASVMVYGMAIREREGKKRLPWSPGTSHPGNLAIRTVAWWPLLGVSFRAILAPLSLMLLPVLLLRAVPGGAHEAFHPILATQIPGWGPSSYAGFLSVVSLVGGILGLTVGGWMIDKVGAQRSAIWVIAICIGLFAAMALARPWWTDERVFIAYVLICETVMLFVTIALIPLCMRLCAPAVAATQFTIYMAVANLGRPLGAALAAASAGTGAANPAAMYWWLTASWFVALAILLFVRFPAENRAEHEAAELMPQGEGLAPVVD